MIKFNKILKGINKISQKICKFNTRLFGGGVELAALRRRDCQINFDAVRLRARAARAWSASVITKRVFVAPTGFCLARGAVATVANLPAALALSKRHKLRRRRRFCGGFRGGFFCAGCHDARNVRAHARPWQAKNARPSVYKRARARPNSSGGVFCIFFRKKPFF